MADPATTSPAAAAADSAKANATTSDGMPGRPAVSTRKPAKEMSKAERRALQEAQRAAKAQDKASKDAGGSSKGASKASSSSGAPGKGADGKKAPSASSQNQARSLTDAAASAGPSASTSSTASPLQPQAGPSQQQQQQQTPSSDNPLSLFLHLDPPSSSKSLNAKVSKEAIHPSILRLALHYADFKIVGANARCIAMLEAFKEVIASYQVPAGKSLPRHLPAHLSPQITHLVRARPMAVSMGNAIRYLKWEIAQIHPDMQDEEAKELLCERIDHFIRDRIVLAAKVIEEHAISKIADGFTILTYSRSSLVEGVLKEAKRQGKRFSVIVVDSRPLHEGKNLLRSLVAEDIPCTYILLSALGAVLPTVDLTLLGTHSLLSNGAMYSRAGTAVVAMMSKSAGIPVICCCETYKFSDRIMLDSVVGNELASTSSLLPDTVDASDHPNLGLLNFLYDVSRPEDVTAVVTETAIIPVVSVPFVLREHKPINMGG